MKMTKSTLTTSLDLPIEIVYILLPAEHGLPEQVDILSVFIEVKNGNGKIRKIQLLSTLDESEILQLEDMVFDSLE
jgi:hypothetical protein